MAWNDEMNNEARRIGDALRLQNQQVEWVRDGEVMPPPPYCAIDLTAVDKRLLHNHRSY